MKRRRIYVIIAIALLIALFAPFSWTTHPDGTIEFSALAVKYVSWATTSASDDGVVQIRTLGVYFFPDNLKDFETLREEFYYYK